MEGLRFVSENTTFYKAPPVILMCTNYVGKLLRWRISKEAFNLSSQLFCVYCHDYIDKHPTKKEEKIKLALGMFSRVSTFSSLPFRAMICGIDCCSGVNFVALICQRMVRSSSLLGNNKNVNLGWILPACLLQACFT